MERRPRRFSDRVDGSVIDWIIKRQWKVEQPVGAKLGQNNIKGEHTKAAIIDAAEELFAESG